MKKKFKNIGILACLAILFLFVSQLSAPWVYNPFTNKLDYYSMDVGGALVGEAAGDVLYHDGTNWTNLPRGANTEVLTLAAGLPSWAAPGAPGAHAASHELLGADLVDHDNLTNFVQAEHLLVGAIDHDSLLNYVAGDHIGLPATIATVLTDHNLAAHTALGLFDQHADVDHDLTTNFVAGEHLLVGAIDHNSLLNYVAGQHIGLPNTIVATLTDHNLAAHTGLGLAITAHAMSTHSDEDTYNIDTSGSLTVDGTVTIPAALTGVIRADSGVLSVDGDVTDIVSAASTTAAGKIEIATGDETNTGTSATLAVSPDALDDWTGSAQITTLGTIGTGIWNAGAVTVADGSSISLQEDITWTGATGVNLAKFPDNLAEALVLEEGGTSYQTFVTTDNSEEVQFNVGVQFDTIAYFDAEYDEGAEGGAFTIDWNNGQKQKVTITGVALDMSFTDPPGPCNLMLTIIQGDGDDTVDWTHDTKIGGAGGTEPTLSTGNADTDVIAIYFDGTNYWISTLLDTDLFT